MRETAAIWLTKVSLNSHDIPWKVLANNEVIMPQILLYSFIEMVMKALSIAQNGLVLQCQTLDMKCSFTLIHFTKGFWAPQDHISKQRHTSEGRGLTPGRV